MGNTQQTVDQTLKGFQRNDAKVMSSIYSQVFPKVRAHVLKNSGNEEHAKDIFQEAFVVCWRNIKEEKFTEGNVSGYLFTIAKNKWTDFLRSPRFKRTTSVDTQTYLKVVSDNPVEVNDANEEEHRRKALLLAMDQLGKNCKTLLKLFYFERRSMDEISREMGMAPNSARNQKYRCMEKLRSLSLQMKDNER